VIKDLNTTFGNNRRAGRDPAGKPEHAPIARSSMLLCKFVISNCGQFSYIGGSPCRQPMSETKCDYEVGRGEPPVHARSKNPHTATRVVRARKSTDGADRGAQQAGGSSPSTASVARSTSARRSLGLSTNRPVRILRAPRIPIDMPNHTEKKAGVTPPLEPRTVHRRTRSSCRPASQGCGNPWRRNLKRGMESCGQDDPASRRHAPP